MSQRRDGYGGVSSLLVLATVTEILNTEFKKNVLLRSLLYIFNRPITKENETALSDFAIL